MKENNIKYTNIYYFYHLSDIGGTETFLYQLAKKYKDLDLTIIYRSAHPNQLDRLKKVVRCVKYTGQKIECERAFFNYGMDIIDNVIAKDYCFVIHADYEDMKNRGQLQLSPISPKINKYIAVSKRAADGFQAVTGIRPEVCYNPFEVIQPKRILNLISATRLSREKGKNRMIQLAEALDKAGINYIWTIFTNDKDAIDNPNIIYMKPRYDILDYIANSDYLVQLSDNEGYCYSVVEALCAGIPVIVTPCPVFKELGLIDGKNCFIYPFDMKNIEVNKLVENTLKFEYKPLPDSWKDFLINKPNTYDEELNTRYLVEALPIYQENKIKDNGLGRVPRTGEQWEVSTDRMLELTKNNSYKQPFVKIVKTIKLK